MTIPSSGALGLISIQNEFGGGSPIGLNEYYKGGAYVSTNDYAPNVPSSGPISISNFYGAKKNTYNSVYFYGSQNFTVPYTSNGSLLVYLIGGGGGGGMHSDYWGGYGASGGYGGYASQSVSVSPGGTYYIEVGGGGSAGFYGYGYKDNYFADGYPGGGGGQSSAFGVVGGGGGGGAGGTLYQNGPNGGGAYGGSGGAWEGGVGGAGSGTGDYIGGSLGGYGANGTGGGNSHDNSGIAYPNSPGPAYAQGTQGLVLIIGWW